MTVVGGSDEAMERVGAAHLRRRQKEEFRMRKGRATGRGSVLHKYIEFIEMSLGIAARRILAAYQPPRRDVSKPPPIPSLPHRSAPHRTAPHRTTVTSSSSHLLRSLR